MIPLRLTTAALVLALATSCSSGLSNRAKTNLSSIAIVTAPVKAKAYSSPQSMKASSAGALGFFSGLTGGLVGGLVAVSVAGVKQAHYNGKHRTSIDAIKAFDPNTLAPAMQTEMIRQLSPSTFYGPRLSPDGRGRLTLEIVSHTLEKIDSTRHSPALILVGTLTGVDGSKIKAIAATGSANTGSGGGTHAAPVSAYASQPGLLASHYQLAAQRAVAQLATALKKAAE